MQRKRRSTADWQKVLAAFRSSNLKPVAFCQANQIGIKSFYRAQIKIGSETGSVTKRPRSDFVKVTRADDSPSPGSSASLGIEVILPHARLRMDAGVSPVWVADLLKSLAT